MFESSLDMNELRVGGEAAWQTAFQVLWPIALRAAHHPMAALDAEDAQEVASDALAHLVPLASKAASVDDLKALVVTLAYRGAISRARHNSAAKRGAKVTASVDKPGAASLQAAADLTLADRLTVDELASLTSLLWRALNVIDPKTRELLLDNILLELTSKELSTKYGMPPGTVSSKLSRGLHRIREALRKRPGLLQQLRGYLR